MASLLTNAAAMTALQTLNSTNRSMDTTQNRISTGLRIATASEGAAYWSIATTMRSDNKALSAVQDALGLGAATVDVQYTALDGTVDQLSEIKKLLTSAKTPGVNRGQIQADIDARLGQMESIASSAVFNSENWLSVDSSATGYNDTKQIVASFTRVGDSITIETIDVSVSDIKLYDGSTTATAVGTAPTADATGAAQGVVKVGGEGLFDAEYSVTVADAPPVGTAAQTYTAVTLSVEDLDISGLTELGCRPGQADGLHRDRRRRSRPADGRRCEPRCGEEPCRYAEGLRQGSDGRRYPRYRSACRRRHERGIDPPPGSAGSAAARYPGAVDRELEQPEHPVAVPRLSGSPSTPAALPATPPRGRGFFFGSMLAQACPPKVTPHPAGIPSGPKEAVYDRSRAR